MRKTLRKSPFFFFLQMKNLLCFLVRFQATEYDLFLRLSFVCFFDKGHVEVLIGFGEMQLLMTDVFCVCRSWCSTFRTSCWLLWRTAALPESFETSRMLRDTWLVLPAPLTCISLPLSWAWLSVSSALRQRAPPSVVICPGPALCSLYLLRADLWPGTRRTLCGLSGKHWLPIFSGMDRPRDPIHWSRQCQAGSERNGQQVPGRLTQHPRFPVRLSLKILTSSSSLQEGSVFKDEMMVSIATRLVSATSRASMTVLVIGGVVGQALVMNRKSECIVRYVTTEECWELLRRSWINLDFSVVLHSLQRLLTAEKRDAYFAWKYAELPITPSTNHLVVASWHSG